VATVGSEFTNDANKLGNKLEIGVRSYLCTTPLTLKWKFLQMTLPSNVKADILSTNLVTLTNSHALNILFKD